MDDAEAPQPRSAQRPRPAGRRALTAVVAGLAVTLAGLGIAAAQTGPSDTPPPTTVPSDGERGPRAGRHALRVGLATAANAIGISEDELRTALRSGQSIAQVAQSKGVDVQKVVDALVEEARSRLAAKVQSGELTQAQADERLANLTPRINDLVNRAGGPGRGPGRHRHRAGLTAAATAIGISEDELRNALRSGQSIAQVAQSKGVDVQKVVDAMVEEARSRITDLVNRAGGPGHN